MAIKEELTKEQQNLINYAVQVYSGMIGIKEVFGDGVYINVQVKGQEIVFLEATKKVHYEKDNQEDPEEEPQKPISEFDKAKLKSHSPNIREDYIG